jgi:enoyl-[acyl-carrier-protein] reductase (NADH)
MPLLEGKTGIVFGVANKRSIAWAIAQAWAREGARLAFTYQGARLKENVEELAATFGEDTLILPCDVTRDEDIAAVFKTVGEKFGRLHLLLHSVAYAPKDALEGEFVNTSREAFRVAHDVSAYSLVALARAAAPLMSDGGSIVAMSYYGARKVVPHYLAKCSGIMKRTRRSNGMSCRRNWGPPGCFWPATARRPSRARCSMWIPAIKSWECDGGKAASGKRGSSGVEK